jgi:glycosyltransferase involved in cell wall biosynthesis
VLRQQVDRLRLHEAVRFLGPLNQTETHALITGGTVFAAPFVVAPDGDREGLPTVVLEAMALGTPVVTTPVTGVPEAVLDDQTGVLVGMGDAAALADAIELLLDDPTRRRRLAAAARRHVVDRFSLPRQAAELAQLRRDRSAPARDLRRPGREAVPA